MGAVAFTIDKLYGSAWRFQPTKLGVERSIIFHEPHTSSKMPYRVARWVWSRLERAYAWSRTAFVAAA